MVKEDEQTNIETYHVLTFVDRIHDRRESVFNVEETQNLVPSHTDNTTRKRATNMRIQRQKRTTTNEPRLSGTK
jgi:hypothetical protein